MVEPEPRSFAIVARSERWSLTLDNGTNCGTVWYMNRVVAQGGMTMCSEIFDRMKDQTQLGKIGFITVTTDGTSFHVWSYGEHVLTTSKIGDAFRAMLDLSEPQTPG